MRKILSLLLLMTATMMAWTGAYAADPDNAEYEAALAAINDGGVYYVKSDVSGTYYYLKGDGTLTATQAEATKFVFEKTAGSKYGFGFKLNNNGTFFSNPPGTNDSALECGYINTSTRGDASWEAQVFFLKDGKYAVRAGNVEDTGGWSHVASSYWTVIGDVDPVVAQYQWDPNYCWELEEDAFGEQQLAASNIAKGWPWYIQSAVGLVKDPTKYVSNAKESSEGSYEALLDNVYTSFFHSAWSASAGEAHYLQAELSQATQKFEFYFKKRSQNNNNRPTTIVISASNDGTTFDEITTLNEGFPTEESVIDYVSGMIDLGAAYKHVRFTVTATNNGATNGGGEQFFTFSEFYIFPGIDAAAQVAAAYNQLAALPWQNLTESQIQQIQTYDTALKAAISTVKVTYELYEADGTTLVASQTVVQQPGSEVNVPSALMNQPQFYDYSVTETNVGMTDCTIKIVRTLKPGFVSKLEDLSNNKTYFITCDRGKFLTKDGYLASTAHSSLTEAEPSTFAILNYEDNYYLYSVADSKFVTNTGALAGDLIADGFHGVFDAIQMTPQTVPYFFWYFTVEEGTNYGLNTNGNDPYGYVINNWMNADPGNLYYMVADADFDPTNALAALDAYFNPSYTVTYVVKDTFGNTIFTSDPQPTTVGTVITTLPADYKRAFYTYNDVNVTIADLATTVEFTATWTGPFELSADFASARWYNMTMRGTWYVTSAEKSDDGAYVTQNNAPKGEQVKDSYQWAFTGNGYEGIKILNKAEGEGKSFGWTDDNQKDAGIPTVMADGEGNHGWKIVASTNTNVPAGSFVLNVAGTNLYPNQYGGEGRPMKFWNSANNVGDAGAAFTVYDVPSFAEAVTEEIAPYFEGKYFVLNDEAKAEVGYEPAYKEDCSPEAYQSMKEKMTAEFLSNPANYVLPATGVYFLKNKNYGTFMGIDPSDANMYGNYKAADQLKQYVTLIKTGDATYQISLMGKYAPATVAQSAQVTASVDAGTYTVVIPSGGYAAFQANTEEQYSALHCAGGGSIVGWEASAAASQWAVEDATSINLTVGEAGYATAYLPFPVEIGKSLSVPAAKGTWTFDNGTGSLTATSGVTVADGVATVPAGDNLAMTADVQDPGTYSFMMDVKVVNEDNGRYTSFYKASDTSADGGVFIYNHKSNGRRIGINTAGMGYGGSYELDTWYRVVVTCENSVATVYVDGEKVVAATSASADHWTLGNVVYFFADNDGEENLVACDELRFWDVALTADEVAMIGAYGAPEPQTSGVAAYTGVINNTWLDLIEVENTIPAYTAVVLKGEPAVYEFAIDKIKIKPEGALDVYDDEVDGSEALVKEDVIENNVLKGTLEPIEAAGKYILAKPEGEVIGFYLAETGTIAAGKAYLEYDGSSDIKGFRFNFDDATGIANVEKNVEENGLIYNVAGQRLNKMQKGINIVNGKKILK